MIINSQRKQSQPFYGSVEFVRDNLGEPVPEETFTHYTHRGHQSSLSAFSIYTVSQKNVLTLKRYSSKLQGAILMKFGRNIQNTLE